MSAPSTDRLFRYRGPHSGNTLALADGARREILLVDGAEISLPPDHPYVLRLVERGYLTAIETPAADAVAPAPTSSRPRGKASSTTSQENR